MAADRARLCRGLLVAVAALACAIAARQAWKRGRALAQGGADAIGRLDARFDELRPLLSGVPRLEYRAASERPLELVEGRALHRATLAQYSLAPVLLVHEPGLAPILVESATPAAVARPDESLHTVWSDAARELHLLRRTP